MRQAAPGIKFGAETTETPGVQVIAAIAAVLVLVGILRVLATRGETVRSRAAQPSDAPLTDDGVRELLARGRKIEAIKVYRKLHGVDLKDAKHAVDRLAEELAPPRGLA